MSFYSELITKKQNNSINGNTNDSKNVLDKIMSVSDSEKKDVLVNFILDVVAGIMEYADKSQISVNIPLMGQGFDSLMTITLRNKLASALKVDISIDAIYEYQTISLLGEYLLKLI